MSHGPLFLPMHEARSEQRPCSLPVVLLLRRKSQVEQRDGDTPGIARLAEQCQTLLKVRRRLPRITQLAGLQAQPDESCSHAILSARRSVDGQARLPGVAGRVMVALRIADLPQIKQRICRPQLVAGLTRKR